MLPGQSHRILARDLAKGANCAGGSINVQNAAKSLLGQIYKYIGLYMFNATPFLPGFPARSLHSVRTALRHSLAPLQTLWGPLLDPLLNAAKKAKGPNSRERLWPLAQTFWTFLSQVFCPGSSCRESVRKAAAWLRVCSTRVLSEDESAYCQARRRLPTKLLFQIWRLICQRLEQRSNHRWCGLEVFIIDGAQCQTPDTLPNQKRWPQPSTQKPGCGFPHIRFLALFSLASGALLRLKIGSDRVSELRLLTKMWGTFRPGSLLLADRHFCSYAHLAYLLGRGLHFAFRLHGARPQKLQAGPRLGKHDQLVCWQKPKICPKSITPEQFAALPPVLEVRLLRFATWVPGFRTRIVYLATSLTDVDLYPREKLAELYRQRWQIELCFRQVKITLQMQYLRCKTPALVIKEILMHCISYNLTRDLMLTAAITYHGSAHRLSFKGTLDTLRHWACALYTVDRRPRKKNNFLAQMLHAIALDPVPERPDRCEPRAVKRRPKEYPFLTKPRKEMKTISHAHRVRAKAALLRPRQLLS